MIKLLVFEIMRARNYATQAWDDRYINDMQARHYL